MGGQVSCCVRERVPYNAQENPPHTLEQISKLLVFSTAGRVPPPWCHPPSDGSLQISRRDVSKEAIFFRWGRPPGFGQESVLKCIPGKRCVLSVALNVIRQYHTKSTSAACGRTGDRRLLTKTVFVAEKKGGRGVRVPLHFAAFFLWVSDRGRVFFASL